MIVIKTLFLVGVGKTQMKPNKIKGKKLLNNNSNKKNLFTNYLNSKARSNKKHNPTKYEERKLK